MSGKQISPALVFSAGVSTESLNKLSVDINTGIRKAGEAGLTEMSKISNNILTGVQKADPTNQLIKSLKSITGQQAAGKFVDGFIGELQRIGLVADSIANIHLKKLAEAAISVQMIALHPVGDNENYQHWLKTNAITSGSTREPNTNWVRRLHLAEGREEVAEHNRGEQRKIEAFNESQTKLDRRVERAMMQGDPEAEFAEMEIGGPWSQNHPEDIKALKIKRQRDKRAYERLQYRIDRDRFEEPNIAAIDIGSQSFQGRSRKPTQFDYSSPEAQFSRLAIGDRRNQNDNTPWYARNVGGRFSGLHGHNLRFASQNIGFGIDDAIQSYHYGGVGASIRAASNNLTAVAGMTIANPAIAAATVVGLSVATAALPMILRKFGWKEGETDAERLKAYDVSFSQKSSANYAVYQAGVQSAVGTGTSEAYLSAYDEANKESLTAKDLTKRANDLDSEMQRLKKQEQFDLEERLNRKGHESDAWDLGDPKGWKMLGFGFDTFGYQKSDVQKQQDKLEKDRQVQGELRRSKQIEAERLGAMLNETRSNTVETNQSDRRLNDRVNRGEFKSGDDLVMAMLESRDRRIAKLDKIKDAESIQKLHVKFDDDTADPELNDRRAAAGINAHEDYLENLRPELNPLTRQKAKLERRMRDLALEKDLPEEERGERLKRILTQAEEDKANFRPSGHHRFISHGYKIDSAEDAELGARMIGNFGPGVERKKHEGQSNDVLEGLIRNLVQQLQVSAIQLGV